MKIYRARKYSSRKNNGGKRIAAYALISLVVLVIMSVWGLTLLANLSNFWDGVKGSNISAPAVDKTSPPAPRLDSLPAYTNSSKTTVSGNAESGSTLTLSRNGLKLDEQLVGNDGVFSFKNIILKEGSNSFSAKAKDGAGNESLESNPVAIILDTVAPKMTLVDPVDGATVTNQYLTVNGKSDARTVVTINDQQQIVGADGSFSGVVTLSTPGANIISIIATDDAGNQTKVTRTVTYAP